MTVYYVDFLWLLPTTRQEQAFKVAEGMEALEQRFEDVGLRYWHVHRDSVL